MFRGSIIRGCDVLAPWTLNLVIRAPSNLAIIEDVNSLLYTRHRPKRYMLKCLWTDFTYPPYQLLVSMISLANLLLARILGP
jgi:hypothetical protein